MAAGNGGPAPDEEAASTEEPAATEEPPAAEEAPTAEAVAEDPANEVLSQGEVTAEAAEPAEVFAEPTEEETA
jgi:hypothetical protein